MLQDYHLYLAARRVRDSLPPRARPPLLHFIHIPWPGPEYWQILPPNMRFSILDSLCAVDILGFQTKDDGLNFIRSCESFLPKSHVNFKHGRIWYRNHATYVRDFPISIDVDSIQNQVHSPEVEEYRSEIETNTAGHKVIVRVDRIEPSKNIVRGFLAFEELLDLHPEHCGEVQFLAYLVPSRMGVEEYNEYLDKINATAGRVNAKYGDSDWEPVRVIIGENYERALAALQLYDVLLVNAIADGMNLVAKEGPIINQKDGVLILSERAGAKQQLGVGAIVIPPCDVYATAESMHQALTMSEPEKKEKSRHLKWIIEKEDIVDWLCRQLQTIEELGL
jgi:trehalose 6-phosphate synthase